jgi:hypothetical protein
VFRLISLWWSRSSTFSRIMLSGFPGLPSGLFSTIIADWFVFGTLNRSPGVSSGIKFALSAEGALDALPSSRKVREVPCLPRPVSAECVIGRSGEIFLPWLGIQKLTSLVEVRALPSFCGRKLMKSVALQSLMLSTKKIRKFLRHSVLETKRFKAKSGLGNRNGFAWVSWWQCHDLAHQSEPVFRRRNGIRPSI